MPIVNILHHVSQIRQPEGSTKCWAACAAMVAHRHGPSMDAIVDAVVGQARSHCVLLYENNALPEGSVGQVTSLFPPFAVDPSRWRQHRSAGHARREFAARTGNRARSAAAFG